MNRTRPVAGSEIPVVSRAQSSIVGRLWVWVRHRVPGVDHIIGFPF